MDRKLGELPMFLANYNIGEFMRFFPEVLNPFKIQNTFKSLKIVKFIFQIMFRIGSLTYGESCSSKDSLSDLNFP
jgi:hypothetical protein